MCLFVAPSAQCDEVLFNVPTRMAPEREVVYLQVLHAPTQLASPVIALENLSVEFAIALHIQSESRVLGGDLVHEASRLMSDRKAFCCGVGRSL